MGDSKDDTDGGENSNTQTQSFPTQSQTQPEVNKLLTDIFGDSDEDEDMPIATNSSVLSAASQINRDDDDVDAIFASDDDEPVKTPTKKADDDDDDDGLFASDDDEPVKATAKKTNDDDDLFGSDDSDDDQKEKSTSKLSRLHKGKASKLSKSSTKKGDGKLSKKDDSSEKKKKKKKKHKKDRHEGGGTSSDGKRSEGKEKEKKREGEGEESGSSSSGDDSYESEGEVERTAEDDQFIDEEDDNADLLAEYAEDNEIFNDDRPATGKKRRDRDLDSDEEEERGRGVSNNRLSREDMQDNNPLSETLRHMKKRKNEDMSEIHKSELCSDLMQRMEKAQREDMEAVSQGRPALCKLGLLKRVQRLTGVKNLQLTLLDNDFLGACKNWIEPHDKKSLPALTVRTSIYSILNLLPCHPDHLRSSGIGKAMLSLMKHPLESTENKRLIKSIIDKWCRPIFGKSADIRNVEASAEEDHSSEMRRAVMAARASTLSASTSSAASSSASGANQNSATRSFIGLDMNMSNPVKKDTHSRVRLPKGTNSGFTYVVRPESSIDRNAVPERGIKGAKGTLLKRMIDGRGKGGKQDFRAEKVALSGRNKS
mmetsp:Transcript_6226/g.6430  ORF Transcript_6226/g.6430 Transcript_6226/m.6430 type:complete len:597 (+) Transcript_6226:83-1873(+)|eukprot:CAMPEP_0182424628 /NCGR_PEP_ID=MMETSP1167-20130531/10851_1 /TAXON_ID=2988 /ORGANISM="Mallomonas Sp, Strain CCMP3275" /LENGTH=596 /DNA_ID=CAMNT_0024604583 /DNA_START=26 /DNA_END=1816 /DNA_ORIENTATION=+